MVWCDFNAAGWDGRDDDPCYYVLSHRNLACSCMLACVFFYYDDDLDDDQQPVIVGCTATFERYKDGWRACPLKATWYTGPRGVLDQVTGVSLSDGAD
jgi:hypothetical protein